MAGDGDGPIAPAPPKTIILLTSGLSWDDMSDDGPLQDVRRLAQSGGVALLNPAVSGEATEAAAFLSVGAGERMAAPETGGPVLWEAGIPRSVSDLAQEVYTIQKREGQIAGLTYRRRMGRYPPPNAAVIHVGLGPLKNAQPTPSRAALVGALGNALRKGGRTVAVWGDWRATLVGMDGAGVVPAGSTLDDFDSKTLKGLLHTTLTSLMKQSDVLIISTSDVRAFRVFVRALSPLARQGRANVLVVSAAPPLEGKAKKWDAFGFIVGAGPYFHAPSGDSTLPGLLVSPTTRTPGLIANVDIAPTVCILQNVSPQLLGGEAGRPIAYQTRIGGKGAFAFLDRFDRQARATTSAAVPTLIGWGLLAFVAAFAALGGAALGSAWIVDVAQLWLLTAAAMFLALLPVGVVAPPNAAAYAMLTLTIAAGVVLAAYGTGLWLKRSPLGLVFAVTVLAIAVDAAVGSPLVSHSALSGYFLSGVRFYGVGNEYMGVLIGAMLAACGLLLSGGPFASRPIRAAFALIAFLLTLLIGVPVLGANAGGAFACTAAFGCAFWALGGKLRARHILLAFALAFGIVVSLALWDAGRPEAARSHIGEAAALGAQQAGGLQKLAALAGGKIAMNARLTVSPYTLAALALFVVLFGWLQSGRIGETVKAALETRPLLRSLVPAMLWGAGAAFVFNDSGIVPALLILACLTASVLDSVCQTVSRDAADLAETSEPSAD